MINLSKITKACKILKEKGTTIISIAALCALVFYGGLETGKDINKKADTEAGYKSGYSAGYKEGEKQVPRPADPVEGEFNESDIMTDQEAEQWAVEYLQEQGYLILDGND
jgi:hypothetical protein